MVYHNPFLLLRYGACEHNNPNYNKGHQDELLDVIEITKPMLILTACMDGKIRLFNLNDKEYLNNEGTPDIHIKYGSNWFKNECWNDEYETNNHYFDDIF